MSSVRSIARGGLRIAPWVMIAGLIPVAGIAAPEPSGTSTSPETAATSNVPGLGIWVAQTGPEGERTRGWVEDQGRAVLGKRNPPLEPDDMIRVALRGGPYDYQIHIALVRRQRLVERQPEVIVCECGSDEMLERVGEAINAGADRLAQVAAEERAAIAAAHEEQESPLDVAPTQGLDARRRPGKLGYAGIGVGVLGVGLLAAGIPLALREEELRGDPGMVTGYTTRPPGIGMAVVGSIGLAAGITLLVVDLVRPRKSSVSIVPHLEPRHAGLTLTRMF